MKKLAEKCPVGKVRGAPSVSVIRTEVEAEVRAAEVFSECRLDRTAAVALGE